MSRTGADNIGRLLLQAFRAFDATLNARLRARGYPDVRLVHSALFAHIDPEGTRPIDLARRAAMTKQSMAEVIADLETKGYVERLPDPQSTRGRLVRLTDRGWRHVRDAAAVIAEIEADYRQLLGGDRLRTLREDLGRMASAPPTTPSQDDPSARP